MGLLNALNKRRSKMKYVRFYRSCNIVGSDEYEDEQFEDDELPDDNELDEIAFQKADESFQIEGYWEEITKDDFEC